MSDHPDYSKIKTVEDAEKLIEEHKGTLYRKTKIQGQIKGDKKESNKAYNEQLKELSEEIDFEVGVIDQAYARIKELETPKTKAAISTKSNGLQN
jgi:hypothetical protein